MKPQPLTAGKGTAMMVFGVPGSGKTRLIGTGDSALIIRPPHDHTDSIPTTSKVEEVVLTDWADALEVFQEIQQGSYTYDWYWLDSLTLWEEQGLADVFQDAVARKPARAEFGPDKGEYGINRSRLGDWVRNMVGLAKGGAFNFGMTAQPMEWFDPVAQQQVWVPMVGSASSGSMAMKMCGYMNIVAYLQEIPREGQPSQRVLLTDSPGFFGKDQLGCFPELKSGRHGIVDPTMDKLTKAISAARADRPAPRRKRAARKRRK